MSVSFLFHAIDWRSWRTATPTQRATFVWEPPRAGAVREVTADRRVREWSYAVAASGCWDSMRALVDGDIRETFDGVFGGLFWERSSGPRRDLPELADAMLSLDPDGVAALHEGLLDKDPERLEPYFDASGVAERRIETFAAFRNYLARWAAVLEAVRDHEALVAI